ncbi:hypothetical protein DSL72_004000 [Monilinia vaccinii-corymbosi]|uniref:Uncharacterized protein n=1 Tax=Monilinia vaccinii-corymbosi TaxID=61207 RepID=A0A8A3P2T6_9HELO|nr:hypothetical protein DSL72_004000 [Monilinia vaccinii-corymbosi]
MSGSNTPAKGMGGRRLKSWEVAAQNPVDIHEKMSDFLKHIEDEAIGRGLAAVAKQLAEMYEANDNEARHFTHLLQRRFQKECDEYDTDTAQFIGDLALGLQTRIASLDKGQPIPEDWPQQMEDWHNKQLSTFQVKLKQKKQKVNGALGTKDREAERERKAIFADQERTLLKLFWDIKTAIDSKERTVGEAAPRALELRPSASAAASAPPRTMLPSTPVRPPQMGQSGPRPSHKRRKTMDHYDPTASPE